MRKRLQKPAERRVFYAVWADQKVWGLGYF